MPASQVIPNPAPMTPPLEVITIPKRPEVSREMGTSWGEHRPEFTAESMPPVMRNLLAFLTVLWAPLLPLLIVLAAVPGIEGRDDLFVAALSIFSALSCALYLVYGSLVANNRALGTTARAWWFVSLVIAGPIGMLFYWRTHIVEARFVPRSRY